MAMSDGVPTDVRYLHHLSDSELIDLADRVDAELSVRIEAAGETPRDPLRVPDDDIPGFVEWLETGYSDNRWSDYYTTTDGVTVWSGKYPAFQRFVADLRPHLHTHGLVIASTRHEMPKKIDGELEHVHLVSAIPMAKAAAEHYDLLCGRLACTHLATAESDYCDDCREYFDDTEDSPERQT